MNSRSHLSLAVAATFACLAAMPAIVGLARPQATSAQERDKAALVSDDNPEVRVLELPSGVDRRALPPGPPRSPDMVASGGFVEDVEPNDTTGTATALPGGSVRVRGNIYPNGDVDFFSFSASAGDRVYAAVMTSFSASGSSDSQLRLFQSDGTTLVEFDEDDGSLGSLSSTLAGVLIPSGGTYYLQVKHFSATNTLRGYDLYFRQLSGAPTPEVEPNDTPATATPLAGNGWMIGARNPAVVTEQDWFSFTAAAGDTVFLSLDLDPERDNVQWNGRLGIALFGDASNQVFVVDDSSTGLVANPLSEALFFTIKTAGTYYAFVDSATAATGGPTATYTLSVGIHPAADEGVNCTTYTSTDVPKTIADGTLVSSTITVPGHPRIADVGVSIALNHMLMADIDAHLRSPAGNDNGIFTDIGAAVIGGQIQMDIIFDDEAGIPPFFTVVNPVRLKPELNYRLGWFDGEDAGGTWTLDLRDDIINANTGTLTSWSLRICEAPPPPACAPGLALMKVFSTNFESGAAGFTHSGAADEWALGLPATVATTTANPVAGITSCSSGVNCWKTDLTGTYEISSNQDLLSPNINLAGFSAPVVATWAQRYQIESATFDHASVNYEQVGGIASVRLFDWLGATMTSSVGTPTTYIGESSGWSLQSGRADTLAGLNTQLRFHLDTDTSINFAGMAIDDVTVKACGPTGFTNDPLQPGITQVRAIHITELRTRVNAVRATYGLDAFPFTDPMLTPGTSAIKAAHITELRTALNDAYTVAMLPLPVYTDPGLAASMTVKAEHVAELRTAVLALES